MSEITYTDSDRFVLVLPYATTNAEGEKQNHFQFITTGPMENHMEYIKRYMEKEISQDLESISHRPTLYRLRAYVVKDGENFDHSANRMVFDSSDIDHLKKLNMSHFIMEGDSSATPGNLNVRHGHESKHRIETRVYDKSFTILFE